MLEFFLHITTEPLTSILVIIVLVLIQNRTFWKFGCVVSVGGHG